MTFRARLVTIALLGLFASSRPARAQERPGEYLDRRISVRFDRVDLATALTRLRTVYGIPLAFSPDVIPFGRPVTLALANETVGSILARMLDGTGLRVIPLSGGTVVVAPGLAGAPGPERSPIPDIASGVHELDQIVVMGTPAHGAPEREQTNAVSIVQGAELRNYHFSRTAELFRTALPGVVLWDQGASGPPAEIAAVRGASSFTSRGLKTYIDGIEVASPALVTLLDPRSIERIEVIRGPQGAALYGSDAINGIIQVITRKGSMGASPKIQAVASAAAGPFDRQAVSTMLRQDYAGAMTWGGAEASMAATGSLGRVGTGTTIPNTRSWGAHGGGQVAFGSLLISGVARGGQFDFTEDPLTGVPVSGSPAAAGAAQVNVATVGVTAVHQVENWWVQSLVLGYDRASGSLGSSRGYLTGIRQPLGATHETAGRTTIRYSSVFTTNVASTESLTTTAGFEHARLERSRGAWDVNESTRYVDLYDDHVRNTGAFLQTKLHAGPFIVNAGARAEWNSSVGANYGTAWAPSVGAAWNKSLGNVAVRIRGGWGRGIRPPEPGMSRAMATSTIRQEGNTTLAPEAQAGFEVGADLFAGTGGYVRATYFNQRATDLIQAVYLPAGVGGAPTYQFQNIGAIRNKGVELEGGLRFGRVGLDGLLYTTSSRVERIGQRYGGTLWKGDQLPEIPTASGSARISYLGRNFQAALGASYIGSWTGYNWTEIAMVAANQIAAKPSRRDYLQQYPGILKPYLSISFDVNRQFTTYLNIDNLTNSNRFERHNGNPPAGRSVLFGLEVKP